MIVDGQAESQALPSLFDKIELPAGSSILRALYADMQPTSSADQIARKARPAIAICQQQGADRIIVLIDLEKQNYCAPGFAQALKAAFERQGHDNVLVVVKHRTFENWLIADLQALRTMSARFTLSKGAEKRIEPDLADSVADAGALLKSMAANKAYHKRKDPIEICRRQSPLNVAANSRSFRRFFAADWIADVQRSKPAERANITNPGARGCPIPRRPGRREPRSGETTRACPLSATPKSRNIKGFEQRASRYRLRRGRFALFAGVFRGLSSYDPPVPDLPAKLHLQPQRIDFFARRHPRQGPFKVPVEQWIDFARSFHSGFFRYAV